MRKLLLLAIFCVGTTLAANAQISPETNTRIAAIQNTHMSELVLAIPHNSAKTAPTVVDVLKGMRGVVFDSYCSHLNTFAVRYDTRITNAKEIINSIRRDGVNFLVIEEKTSSIDKVKQHCYK